jgi:hypothetical protein
METNLMPTTSPICGVKSKHSRLKPIAFAMNVAEATLVKQADLVFREFMKYTFWFLIETILLINSFIFCFGMSIQKNYVTPAAS